MKSIFLLSTALFLISAPQPDSATVAEMTANFIVPRDAHSLQAADGKAKPAGCLKVVAEDVTGALVDCQAATAPGTGEKES